MKKTWLFVLTYVLTLATQLPHVWFAYASLEDAGLPIAHITAFGAATAFELSTGVFTWRVVAGSRRRWTRVGLAFFILSSAVANAYYYRWLPSVFDTLMPIFATVALPLALALFAEEFGVELKREQSRESHQQREQQREQQPPAPLVNKLHCDHPGCTFVAEYPTERYPALVNAQNALAGHRKIHHNGRE